MHVLFIVSLLTDILEVENNKKFKALLREPDCPHCECHEKTFSWQKPQFSNGVCFIQYQFLKQGCSTSDFSGKEVWIEDMSGDATSNKVQLFRTPSPACSPEVANSCITHSLSFSHCLITFMCEKWVLIALLDFICKALMQPRVIQTAECAYVWTSLNITQFINCTFLLEIAGNYWTIMESLQLFPAFSLYRSLAVIACWFSAKQLSGEKHFQGTEVWLKSHHEQLSPTMKHSLHWILQADFFLISWPLTVEVGPWWCPFNWCPLCSQICCNAVWQLQYKDCLLCFEKLLCKYTSENFSYQKSKDAGTYRYISTHTKKPLELWIQFNPGDSTFLHIWTLGWVWSCLLLLRCISVMNTSIYALESLATLSW